MINKDIFQEDDDQWYFQDTSGDIFGPFKTLELAEQVYNSSEKLYDRPKNKIKKMKHSMGT